MRIVMLKLKSVKLIFLCSVFAIVTHVFSMYYPALTQATIEDADLTVLKDICIVIDPGHGGIDDGATHNNVVEKEINLAISVKLAAVLNNAGASIVMTREDDVDYYTRGKGGKRNDLLKRVEIIQNANPRLFVSIHANAIAGSKWTGAQVFYSPNLAENKLLAETVQHVLQKFPEGNRRQAKQDLDIIVLNRTNIPGILIETGYISNPGEAAKLANPKYQQDMVDRIAIALAYHLRNNAGR